MRSWIKNSTFAGKGRKMLLPLKHIIRLCLYFILLGSVTSCQSWREARNTMIQADSLLANGVIIQDTAILADVIDTWDHFIVRFITRNKLAKAYYLMGRNMDDYHHHYADAADFYIQADRLNTRDHILRGRINSCMGFICKQDSCFEEACKFYERSSRAFKEAGNDWYYAHNLLNIAEQYVNLKEYNKADSILQIANNYDIDSTYHAMLIETRGLYFFALQQYDSALTYFLSIENFSRPLEARCYSYMKIMQIYNQMHDYSNAIEYAKYIILHSSNPNYRLNAYYHLIDYAKMHDDMELLTNYSHERDDENRVVRQNAELYAQASAKLKSYILNPNPYGVIYLCFAGAIILFLILVVFAYIIYKRHQSVSRKNEEMVYSQEEQRIAKRKLFERKIFDHSVYFLQPNIWKDTNKLREQANIYCGNIFYRLEETYHFSEQEMKICLMVLLEFPREQMANYLYVQPNTISKAKGKIAKILGTTSSDLRNFLIDFLAS